MEVTRKLSFCFVLVTGTFFCMTSCSKIFEKHIRKEDEKLKAKFPAPLSSPFPTGSLGEKVQEVYKEQAIQACGINRNDSRLFIPQEIVNGYGEQKLRSNSVYEMPLSSTNLLFFALKPNDIQKIKNQTFVESEYIRAHRVIGLKDNLVNYGQSSLSPIQGFPSLYYQKSCGSYFTGNVGTKVKSPVAELESSLDAETKKSSLITTVTGKFFSPLYLRFSENSNESIYAHLLLWEAYYNDFIGLKPGEESLIEKGQYISELNATMINRSYNSEQSMNMNAKLSANVSAGIVGASGEIRAGFDKKVSFELKDFRTLLHKQPNGSLSWALTDLPRTEAINKKLQSSLNKSQPSVNGFVTNLLPTEISRVLIGIPGFLCDRTSWSVEDNGYDVRIWRAKPIVISQYKVPMEGAIPECICKVTGFIKKESIDAAIGDRGALEIKLSLVNDKIINDNKLRIEFTEPSVKVTDSPKLRPVNSELVNAGRSESSTSNRLSFQFPISFLVDDTGINIKKPIEVSNLQIDYINPEQNTLNLGLMSVPEISGNSISLIVKTEEKPKDFDKGPEIVVPIKIRFLITLGDETKTQLSTNTINLSIPTLRQPTSVEAKVLEGN